MKDTLEWFRVRGKWLKIDRIATEIGAPGRTLRAWVDGNRPLPEKWQAGVKEWVDNFLKDQ